MIADKIKNARTILYYITSDVEKLVLSRRGGFNSAKNCS